MHQRMAVVGAGPAGTVAGVLLQRRGYQVDLYEQTRFPRSKVCGECLSALGYGVLERMGLVDALLGSGAVRLQRAILYAGDATPLHMELPQPMWGISRHTLDMLLLEQARDAGVQVHQPARVERVEPGTSPRLIFRDLHDNRVVQADYDLIVLADGKGALLGSRPAPTGDLGFKTHYRGVQAPVDAIGLYGGAGWYGGLAPIEGGVWNIACAVPSVLLRKAGGDPDRLLMELCRVNPVLDRQMTGARRVAPWMICPLPRFPVVRMWPAGVIPLGNAVAALEPIGGEGMGLAMRSAEMLVEMLAKHQKIDIKRLQCHFNHLWCLRRWSCRGVGLVMSGGLSSKLSLKMGRTFSMLSLGVMLLMGKQKTHLV